MNAHLIQEHRVSRSPKKERQGGHDQATQEAPGADLDPRLLTEKIRIFYLAKGKIGIINICYSFEGPNSKIRIFYLAKGKIGIIDTCYSFW